MPQYPIENDPLYEIEREKYRVPIPSREYIAQVLKEVGAPTTLKHLCRLFGIKGQRSTEAMRRRLIAMFREAQVLTDRRGRFFHVSAIKTEALIAQGVVAADRDGKGWVESKTYPVPIVLSPAQMQQVFVGDVVQVEVTEHLAHEAKGKIHQVLQRCTWVIKGYYNEEAGIGFVTPLELERSYQKICIEPVEGIKEGDIVQIEIIEQPTLETLAKGRILAETECASHLEFALEQARLTYQLPDAFDAPIIQAAEQLALGEVESNRKDLRHLPFVTIDGEDAKDFDDAVYAERKKSGGWRLYVAIADVGYYVRPGDDIDVEAQKRSTSTYFPEYVVPMLPEQLSNELCSLKPKQDRYTLVCEMTISQSGRLSGFQFYAGVIHSHARLTYTQVGRLIEKGKQGFPKEFHALVPSLTVLIELYRVLLAQREVRGAIDFDVPEPFVELDNDGNVKQVSLRIRNEAHRLIEECMLLANVAAAKLLLKHDLAGLYRVHDAPKAEKVMELRRFLSLIGIDMPSQKEEDISPADFNTIVKKIAKRPDCYQIQLLLLRTMTQARYQPDNNGHFGLAYPAYTHFTSPIRRYPDLIVHRAIRYFINYKDTAGYLYSLDELEELGVHTSHQERKAEEASRFVVSLLKAQHVERYLGESFTGTVSGVREFGFFVTLDNVIVDGLVHVRNLRGEYYRYDETSMALVGERTKRSFSIGDRVQVLVAKVDTLTGRVDLELAGEHATSLRNRSKRKSLPRSLTKEKKTCRPKKANSCPSKLQKTPAPRTLRKK